MVGDSGRPFEMRAKSLTGEQLRAWRLANDWSPDDFWRHTGIRPQRLADLEEGREPVLRRLEMMVERSPQPRSKEEDGPHWGRR